MMPRVNKKSAQTKIRAARERRRSQLNQLSAEERERWLMRHAEYQRERRARLPPERLQELRLQNALRNRRRRAAMSDEQLEAIRKENRERTRRRRDSVRKGVLPDSAAFPAPVAGSNATPRSPPKKRVRQSKAEVKAELLGSVDKEVEVDVVKVE